MNKLEQRSLAFAAVAAMWLLAAPLRAQVDPDCAGGNPGTVDCTATTYADGITHAANGGDLTVNSANGVTSYGTGGFITSAMGDNSLTITKGTGNLSNNATTGTRAPVVIGATTVNGDISVTTQGTVQGAAAFVQYGVLAETLGGNINLNLGGTVAASGTSGVGVAGVRAFSAGGGNIDIVAASANANANGGIGLQAISTGGDIAVVTTGTIGTQPATGNSNTGVYAETSGAGTINLDLSGQVRGGGSGSGAHAVADTGSITINLSSVTSRGGVAVTTQSNGVATINLNSSISVQSIANPICSFGDCLQTGVDYAVRSSGSGSVEVNVIGPANLDPVLGEVDSRTRDGVNIFAPFDFSGLQGGAAVNFHTGSLWHLSGRDSPQVTAPSVFSPGDDTVSIASGAMMLTSPVGRPISGIPAENDRFLVDFGDGEDRLENAGTIVVGSRFKIADRGDGSTEMRFENLELFENAGTIWMGAGVDTNTLGNPFLAVSQNGPQVADGDRWPDDILALPGARFHGVTNEEGAAIGRIIAHADIGKIGQAGCGFDFRVGDSQDLPVMDCIDLRDGYATGKTNVLIVQQVPGDRGAFNPEGSVIVDASGAQADLNDPQAFGVDPDSVQFGTIKTADGELGAIDKGIFFYAIGYDAEVGQYKLYGLQGQGTQQFPLLMTATNRLWQRSAGAWFDRQVDQRDLAEGTDVDRGLWFRVSSGSTDRDLNTQIMVGSQAVSFDNSYVQDDVTTTFGWDWIGQSNELGSFVAGGMLGYARSDVDFDESPNRMNLRGMHLGAYSSLTIGSYYLDMAISQMWLDLDNDQPALNLEPDTAILSTRSSSIGGRLETGWRIPVGFFQVEPLAGLSWVKTSMSGMRVPASDPDPDRIGGNVSFEDQTQNNFSYGLRVSVEDLFAAFAPTGISLTVRSTDEINGTSTVSVANRGPINAPATDTLDGTFTQFSGSIHVSNTSRSLAGYVNVDSLDGDDLSSVGIGAGVRYQW
jgi:hypothetical protein